MKPEQLRLYLVTDEALLAHEALLTLLPALIDAGVSAVQLRHKAADTRTLLSRARDLKAVLGPRGVPLIINDRVDVALAVGAEGVHVGAHDMSAAQARGLVGPGRSVGVSIEALTALDAAAEGADVLSVSPVFPTATKTDTAPALGIAGVAEVCARTRRPVCAIGGIDAGRARDVVAAGAEGVAVVSAILGADDPVAAAAALRASVEEGLRARSRVPNVLTIAGSDSGGGAGIQADLKTFAAHGVFGCSVITAVTAQNTRGVTAIAGIAPDVVRAQLDAVFDDIRIDAVKIGMLSHPALIATVAEVLATRAPAHVVLDPVMVAQSGARLIDEAAVDALARELLPLASVLTPNLPEAGALLGVDAPQSLPAMMEAAHLLLARGPTSVLLKGGHLPPARLDPPSSPDVWVTRAEALELHAPRINTPHTHGTGCTLSSAIAARLARGAAPSEAVRGAKAWLTEALRSAHVLEVGSGAGPVDHGWQQR